MRSRTKYIIAGATVFLALMAMGYALWGQEKPSPKEYRLSEIQLLKLQVVQRDAMLLKSQMQDLQRQFGDKVGDLQRTAEKIKLENSWPPETRFDMDKLEFSAPPAKEEKK